MRIESKQMYAIIISVMLHHDHWRCSATLWGLLTRNTHHANHPKTQSFLQINCKGYTRQIGIMLFMALQRINSPFSLLPEQNVSMMTKCFSMGSGGNSILYTGWASCQYFHFTLWIIRIKIQTKYLYTEQFPSSQFQEFWWFRRMKEIIFLARDKSVSNHKSIIKVLCRR